MNSATQRSGVGGALAGKRSATPHTETTMLALEQLDKLGNAKKQHLSLRPSTVDIFNEGVAPSSKGGSGNTNNNTNTSQKTATTQQLPPQPPLPPTSSGLIRSASSARASISQGASMLSRRDTRASSTASEDKLLRNMLVGGRGGGAAAMRPTPDTTRSTPSNIIDKPPVPPQRTAAMANSASARPMTTSSVSPLGTTTRGGFGKLASLSARRQVGGVGDTCPDLHSHAIYGQYSLNATSKSRAVAAPFLGESNPQHGEDGSWENRLAPGAGAGGGLDRSSSMRKTPSQANMARFLSRNV